MKNNTFDFWDLFIEGLEEQAEESLKNGSVDDNKLNNLQKDLNHLLQSYKTAIKILEGKKTKKKFFEVFNSDSNSSDDKIFENQSVALAFRKAGSSDNIHDDLDKDLTKLKILKKIKNENIKE
jgi:hypothetical protein